MTVEKYTELLQLLSELREESITDERFQHLDRWLAESEVARRIYLDYFKMCGNLHAFQLSRHASSVKDVFFDEVPEQVLMQEDLSDNTLWKILAEEERTAETITIEKPEPEPELIQKVERVKFVHKVNKFSIVSAAMSIAAILLLVIFIKVVPAPSEYQVATLTDAMNVKWAGDNPAPTAGDRLSTRSDSLSLLEGIAEITYDNGVEVIVEGPAEFELLTNMEISVNYGRLFARISEQGKGFAVVTHNSRIIDLGTEFGVYADIYGGTELQVYKGRTTLIAGEQDEAKQVADVLAGYAKKVSRDTGAIQDIELNETAFVRSIDSSANQIWRGHMEVDLADVVCGGNGFGTGSKTLVLDPLDGKFQPVQGKGKFQPISEEGQRQPVQGKKSSRQYIKPEMEYCTVDSNPFIDGVFVPDGKQDKVVVSSEQHLFPKCPETSGTFHHYISNGPFEWAELEYYSPEGAIISAREKQSIYMHANLGITFDLDKIRQRLPELSITTFETICVREFISTKEVSDKAAFVVLADGKVRFWSQKMSEGESKPVSVELSETDRFLTLITVDSNDGVDYNRTYFVEPKLLLKQ